MARDYAEQSKNRGRSAVLFTCRNMVTMVQLLRICFTYKYPSFAQFGLSAYLYLSSQYWRLTYYCFEPVILLDPIRREIST